MEEKKPAKAYDAGLGVALLQPDIIVLDKLALADHPPQPYH